MTIEMTIKTTPAMQTPPTGLETWLKQATRHLSKDSAAQVRTEIREHYESAREAAMNGGANADEADEQAVAALGNAKTANCQYRNVLLTSTEARLLREGNAEARAVCSHTWVKALLLAMSGAALFAANEFFLRGDIALARALFAGSITIGLVFAAPFLPVYTLSRARAFRVVKWVVMLCMLVFAFGPDAVKWSWLLFSCLWPMAWVEWTRVSIRRKLPVEKWPRQLYL
jgi:hypothetical protein